MLIALCILLLLAYIFDISSGKTRVPTVIWLLALGFGVAQWVNYHEIAIPYLNPLLPYLGTIGLILIVLEGALELELNRNKKQVLLQTGFLSTVGLLVSISLVASLFHYLTDTSWRMAILNAIPLSVISSAIAVPSVAGQPKDIKEFVIYETSFSDILGVLAFNFVLQNQVVDTAALTEFGWEMVIILVLSFVSTAGLALLLRYATHKVKFVPILVMTVLIYALQKEFHLPALIFILVFGLFLGNLKQIPFGWYKRLFKPEVLQHEVHKLHELLLEGAFLVRSLFFILLGFTLKPQDLTDINSWGLSVGIVALFVVGRGILLAIMRKPPLPLLFVAPRGLITILLFISIPTENVLPIANNAVVVQVILLMVVLMMVGLFFKPEQPGDAETQSAETELASPLEA